MPEINCNCPCHSATAPGGKYHCFTGDCCEHANMPRISDETIRDWSKKVLHDWAAHLVGEGGWDERGASHPDEIIDCIFSQIQVTLLGYAKDMQEADAKRKVLDGMLRVKNRRIQ